MGVVKRQGLTNTAIVLLGTLIGAISLLIVQPYCLSKEELGLTRLILSFATVLASVLSFGVSSMTVRYLPKVFEPATHHRGFFGFMLLYVSASVCLGILALLALRQPLAGLYGDSGAIFSENLLFVVLLSVSYSLVLGFNAYSIALMRTVFPTLVNDIGVRLLFIAVIVIHYFGHLDAWWFLLAFTTVYSLQALVMLVYVLLAGDAGMKPDFQHIRHSIGLRSILRYGSILTFTAINSVSLKYLDTIFVGRISLDSVAVYSVAAFVGILIEIPLNALERIANPSISHALARNDMDVVRTVYHDSSRALLFLGGWLFLMVALNVGDLLRLLPEGYEEGVLVTQVIALGALVNMATGVNYPILANSHKYIWGSVFLVILLAATVIGNLVLIPRMGMLGAAVAGCFASVLYNVLKFEFIRRVFGLQPFDRSTVVQVLIVGALLLVGMLVDPPFGAMTNMVLRGVIITLAYAAITIALRTSTDLYHHIPANWRARLPFLR